MPTGSDPRHLLGSDRRGHGMALVTSSVQGRGARRAPSRAVSGVDDRSANPGAQRGLPAAFLQSLSLWSWKDAFTALFLDRVTLVANYDIEAHSPSRSLKVPSVVALKSYVALARSPGLHALQHLSARHLHLPVLRSPPSLGRSDFRSRRAPLPRRPLHLGKRRGGLLALQPSQGQPHAGRGGDAPSERAAPADAS
jgi:hypothetical protein